VPGETRPGPTRHLDGKRMRPNGFAGGQAAHDLRGRLLVLRNCSAAAVRPA